MYKRESTGKSEIYQRYTDFSEWHLSVFILPNDSWRGAPFSADAKASKNTYIMMYNTVMKTGTIWQEPGAESGVT